MKKTLVFGASLKSERHSNLAVARLKDSGIDTMAFGPVPGEIHGVTIYTEPGQIRDIDTVSLYMNPTRQKEFYDTILNLRPRRVIFNPGTENPEFYNLLVKERIVVEESCTLTLLVTGQY